MTSERRIAHVDMDAFFASCELSRYPELRGVPLVVCGGSRHAPRTLPDGTLSFSRLAQYMGRGVLTTATYEARALGVHSGMPAMKAASLAPNAVLLPVNFELYRHHSKLFKGAVLSVSEVMQDVGIDEVYADVSAIPGDSRTIAQRLKDAVKQASGLTCSVGIAPNKLLAKLCSDLNKPDGITVVTLDDIPTRIWPLPAKRINGIGPKATAKLMAMGITTIGELAARDKFELVEVFGRAFGAWMHEAAHGRDERPVQTQSEPVSMSRETTFERDMHAGRDRAALGKIFTALCQELAEDLQRTGYVGKTIGIKLRFDDFKTATRDLTLQKPISDATDIRKTAGACLKRVDLTRRLRLLGVRVSNLERENAADTVGATQASFDFGSSHP